MSAAAEWLVAYILDREWLSDGEVPDGASGEDVDGGISVRWTERRGGSLIIHPDDPAPYSVLVVGDTLDALLVPGYIPTELGKARRWWRDDVRHPAYFVPQSALYPLESFNHGTQCQFFGLT